MDLKIAIGSDHGAFELKEMLVGHLRGCGCTVIDLGTCNGDEKVEYPIIAKQIVDIVLDKSVSRGILLCGTGIGVSIAANRFPGIRATLCYDEYTARMSRQHNNSNILVMGGRTTDEKSAKIITDIWLNTEFEGGRHSARLDLLEDLSRKYLRSNEI